MANITSTSLANGIPTVVAARVLGYLKANTVFSRLVSRDWDNELSSYGDTVDITQTATVSIGDKAADTAVTPQDNVPTKVSVTLDKHKYFTFRIEDVAKALSKPEYLAQLMSDGMAKMSEQVDSDIAALYSGLSQTIDATAGLNEDDFREARRQLNSAKVPLGGRFAVIHEDAEFELLAIDKFVNRDYAELQGAPQGLLNAYTGKFMGFNIYMNQNIPVVTTQCKNIFGHKDAFVLVTRPLDQAPEGMGVVQSVMDEDGLGLRVTMGYDQDHLALQVTVDLLYGVAELRDNHGIVVSTTEI